MAAVRNEDGYYHAGHCKYLAQYHLIWCPKFRFPVLGEHKRREAASEFLREICEEYGYELFALEVMPDHVHIFLAASQTVAPCDIARTLKSLSAVRLLSEFPDLKQFYARCGTLWSRGYFISTIGRISEQTVKRYIEEQTHHEEKEAQA